ncbi:MAG: DUF1254 domain-containing protein [Parvibaculum sp.]|uniref:DUF1254 domain-containing protein n=1 Tax=Parvibaculum sp. TaxID=2024848 RepID=UPI00283EFCC1|nr:DUF1254 domain-containing protein [Parvibaculum sp.]MDR3497805.1 DUF1254 domain-containing protein [Parvibaculum sp.]
MKRPILFILGVALVAGIVHVAAMRALPDIVMSRVMSKIGTDTKNAFVSPPLATAAARTIVRPSPDLAYSTCVLDLSKGPVRVTVPLTAPYTSVALYSARTDNYFVRKDRDAAGKDLDIIVVGPGAPSPANVPSGVDVVTAPTARGLVLVRRVVESPEAFPALDAIRHKATCAPYKG